MASRKGRRTLKGDRSTSGKTGFLGRFVQLGRQKITIMLILIQKKGSSIFKFPFLLFHLSAFSSSLWL